MPFSSDSGKAWIRQQLAYIRPDYVIDIGAGSGTYSKLYRDTWPGAKWVGVEIWQDNVEKYALTDLYDGVVVADVRKMNWEFEYDVAFFGDVLEHMTEAEASRVFKTAKKHCRFLFISIPLGHYPQGEYDGNPYETHVEDHWTDERVRKVFGEPLTSIIDGEIGVYLYRTKLNIAVYAISKNEEQFAERFCKAASDADLIFIADTGSTDSTVHALQQNGAVVRSITVKPWRFDDARNAALALIPPHIDVCVSLDLDEVLQPGWREEIERIWRHDTTRLRYGFDWGCGIVFSYEKIHSRFGYRWHHPCHEYPVPDRITEVWAHTDRLLVIHQPDSSKSRGQYLDLLRVSIEEDPRCPRNAFYYARELSFHKQWDAAIREVNRYLALPEAVWPNERCYAMRVAGRSCAEMGDRANAILWFRKAAAEAPNTREPWCELAMECYIQHRWPECYGAAMTALDIKNRELVYTVDPSVWGALPHDLAALAAWHLGLRDEAVKHGSAALAIEPTNPRLLQNFGYYSSKTEMA